MIGLLFIILGSQMCVSVNLDSEGKHIRIRSMVQPVLDHYSAIFNSSLSFGYADSLGRVSLISNSPHGKPITEDTVIPLGSIAKSWIMAWILKKAEAGELHLKDLASKLVDPTMKRLNGTTIADLWGEDVAAILTVDDLVSMRSGFQDYNDTYWSAWNIDHPGMDILPFDYLHRVDKKLACPVGTCAWYSSINYMLLGFALVELEGLDRWDDLDQLGVLSPEDRNRYGHTSFAGKGPCSKTPHMAHQFLAKIFMINPKTEYRLYEDIIDDSCLNGWTCGNIISTGGDAAQFFYDLLLDKRIINDTTPMIDHFEKIQNPWCPVCYYSRGLIRIIYPFFPVDPSVPAEDLYLTGHPGIDWGSSAPVCGANLKHGFTFCLAFTAAAGMNCSLPNVNRNEGMTIGSSCYAYDAVMKAVGGPRINCTYAMPPVPLEGPKAECQWKRGRSGVQGFSLRDEIRQLLQQS